MHTSNPQEKTVQQRRLAWRCRRGMLELDIVLQRFIAEHFSDLNTQELAALELMLDLPDNDFWRQVSDVNAKHESIALQSVLGKMRAA